MDGQGRGVKAEGDVKRRLGEGETGRVQLRDQLLKADSPNIKTTLRF